MAKKRKVAPKLKRATKRAPSPKRKPIVRAARKVVRKATRKVVKVPSPKRKVTRKVTRAPTRKPTRKVTRKPTPKRAPEPKRRRKVYGEYEVTARYKSSGQVVDVTARVRGPAGATADVIKKVVWRAALGRELTEYQVETVDWRREYVSVGPRGGVRRHLSESSGEADDLQAFRGILRKGKIRIAEVAED